MKKAILAAAVVMGVSLTPAVMAKESADAKGKKQAPATEQKAPTQDGSLPSLRETRDFITGQLAGRKYDAGRFHGSTVAWRIEFEYQTVEFKGDTLHLKWKETTSSKGPTTHIKTCTISMTVPLKDLDLARGIAPFKDHHDDSVFGPQFGVALDTLNGKTSLKRTEQCDFKPYESTDHRQVRIELGRREDMAPRLAKAFHRLAQLSGAKSEAF